jgi:exopolysaccharide production protein ExoZ
MSKPTEISAPNRTFLGIQMLRGVAALMVVVHHATLSWATVVDPVRMPYAWMNGAAGVDIFFVLSGFVMYVSTVGREQTTHPARSFLERRFLRVVPLYWLATALVLVKVFVENRNPALRILSSPPHLQPAYILSSFFLFPYKNSQGTVQPLLIVGWTLIYEMFFYLLFSVPLGLKIGVARFLTPVMVLLSVVGIFAKDSWPTVMWLASPLLLEFLSGLLLGVMVVRGVSLHSRLWIPLALASSAYIFFFAKWQSNLGRVVFWGIPAFLLVLAVVGIDSLRGRLWPGWILAVGDASYSLYLMHLLIFSFLMKLLVRFHVLAPGASSWDRELLTVVLLVTPSVLISIAIFRWVDSPMTRILRRRLLREKRPLAHAI